MAKSHDPVQRVEDDRMVDHSVIIKLPKILDLSNAALVVLEVVLLQANSHRRKYAINDRDHKARMVPVNGTEQNCENVYAAVFDLAGLRKHLGDDCDNLRCV